MSNYLIPITKKSFWLPPPLPVSQLEVSRNPDEPSLAEATPAVISHIEEWPVDSGRVGQASGSSSSRRERRRAGQAVQRPFNAVDDSVLIPFDTPLAEKEIPKPMKPFLPANRISNPAVIDALGRTVIPMTDEGRKTLGIFPRARIEEPTPEVVDAQTGRVITPATEGKRAPVHPDSDELWGYQMPARLRVSPRNPRLPEPHEGNQGLPPNLPSYGTGRETGREAERIRGQDSSYYLNQIFIHSNAQKKGQQRTIFNQIDQDTAFARQQAIDFGRDDPWDDSWMRTPSYLEYIQEQTDQQRPPYHGREAAQSLYDEMTSQEKAAYRQAFRERATTEEEYPQESEHLQAAAVYARLRQMLPANMRQTTRRGRRGRRGRR